MSWILQNRIRIIKKFFLLIIMLFVIVKSFSQDISLLYQFNGKMDFTMIGNTLNLIENEALSTCTINTSSSANLNLNSGETIVSAYLYWAGSGTGDLEIKLNGQNIVAQRTFENFQSGRPFFSAYADVTSQVQETGNGNYTVSELDLTDVIANYCANGTNFGGWAIVIIYRSNTLPFNQINIYDGMQSVPSSIAIHLDNLNVIDNAGAKIGFIAWEGDSSLAVNESLRINGDLIGNPPLNPSNNAFNGTNSFTGETNLYNMDLDYYDIENYIEVGDTEATIELTSGQDYVMVNCVVTKLNSHPPRIIQIPTVPEGFSPNGDAINDVFLIRNLRENYGNFELKIYNRYGNIVYEGDKNSPDWDGTYNEQKLPASTYYYLLNLNDNYIGIMRGWVYLNR